MADSPSTNHYKQKILTLNNQGPKLEAVYESTLQETDQFPVLLKDNIDTPEMGCSAGSIALAGVPVPYPATLVVNIEARGGRIFGKTNLSEWANFRSTRSTSGWSSYGGQTKNPYATNRSPSGSSSGSAVAVASGMAPVAIGTETDGSIISPASHAGIVGIKPSLGYVSRHGIVPIAASQDTAGPMALTVKDAAMVLEWMAGFDPRDPATEPWEKKHIQPATTLLHQTDLKNCRIGSYSNQKSLIPGVTELFKKTIGILKDLGAEIIPIENEFEGLPMDDIGNFEYTILLCEFKDDLATYLRNRRPDSPYKNLESLINFNQNQDTSTMALFDQDIFLQAQATGGRQDPKYRTAKNGIQKLLMQNGLEKIFDSQNLDAMVMPSNGPAWVRDTINGDRYTGGTSSYAAVSGWPSLTLGMGHFRTLPIGLSFMARPWDDYRIIGMAQAFQHHHNVFRAPDFPESPVL